MVVFAALNRALGALLESLLLPLDALSPLIGVAAISILVATGTVLVFKAASDQKGIASAKRLMQAGLFEMRLFSSEPLTVFQAQRDILRAAAMLLRFSAVPFIWMILPLALLTTHLESHYGYQGLRAGRPALLKVLMRPGWEQEARSLTLEVPGGLRVETPMVWAPALHEASWRISADRDGQYVVNVALHGARFAKTVLVSSRAARRSPRRLEGGLLNQFEYPSEPPLATDSPIRSIAVGYPEGYLRFAGRDIRWLSAFLTVSLVAALALGRFFHVTF